MVDNLAQLEYGLGTTFAEKYQKALSEKKTKKFDLTAEAKVSVVEAIKINMDPISQCMKFERDGNVYDVAIFETMKEIRPKQCKYSISVPTKIGGAWVTLWINEENFKKLVPNNLYVIIGKMSSKPFNGKTSYSFSVHELASMAELAEWNVGVPPSGIKVTQL